MKEKEIYNAPSTEAVLLAAESIICASGDNPYDDGND